MCAALLPLAGCADRGPVEVVAPRPAGEDAAACRALALPGRVADQERGATAGRSPYTAVWGDPAVVLRCGVARPAVLTPGAPSYDPLADAVEVNGVSWLLEETGDGVRFTTTQRTVFVEVTVPGAYAPEINALVDLATAVDGGIPQDPLYAEEG